MEIILKDKLALLVGRRGSGKSILLKYLIKKQRHWFKEIFIISPSSFSGYWKDTIPDGNVFEQYSEEWVQKLIDKMARLNKGKDQKHPNFVRVLLVLDDCVSSDMKAHQSKTLRILSARGRHIGVCAMITAQYLKSVPPLMRNNADYIFYGKSNTYSDEILFEEFAVANDMTRDQFIKFIRINTDDHRFLVICNCASNTSNRLDVYGTIRAELEKHPAEKNNLTQKHI